MKDALRTSGLFTRIQLGLINGLLGLPVAISVSHDLLRTSGFVSALVLLGIFSVGPFDLGLSCAASFAVVAFLLGLNEIFVPNYEFDGIHVMGMVAAALVSCLIILKKFLPRISLDVPQFGAVLFSAALILAMWQWRLISPHESLSLLANSSNSYSEYLSALAKSTSDAGLRLIPESSIQSGPLLGLILVMGRMCIDWINPDLSLLKIENAKYIVHILLALTAITSSAWFGISTVLFKNNHYLTKSFFCSLSALAATFFSLGLIQTGQIDVQVSYLFISIGIWVIVGLNTCPLVSQLITWMFALFFFFSAALSWLPSIWIGIACLCLSSYRLMPRPEHTDKKRTLYFSTVGVIITLIIWFTPLWQAVTASIDGLSNQTLPGGATAVYPLMILFVLCTAVWLIAQTFERGKNEVINSVLIGLVALPALFLVASYFQHPFRPTEATWLFVYLTMSLLLPLLMGLALDMFSRDQRNRSQRIVVNLVAMVALVVTVLPQISNSRSFANQEKRNSKWAERVLAEYQKAPARPVACLNTTLDDVSGDVEAQLCTQMSFRLAGFVAPIYESWGEATGCTATVNQATTLFSREMLANLTLILSDPTRTSSMAGCQAIGPNGSNGWLTNIEWPYVRKINITGVEVFPKPTRVGS